MLQTRLFRIDLTLLWSAVIFSGLQNNILRCSTATAEDLQPPHSVEVVAKTENSLTLSWSAPQPTSNGPKVISYSVSYFISPDSVSTVTTNESTIFISSLQPATEYTFFVSANYLNNQSASSPKFIVLTLKSAYQSRANAAAAAGCSSCIAIGTAKCSPPSETGVLKCFCKTGYEGEICDSCSDNYYSGDENSCLPCNCPSTTTLGSCIPNVSENSGRECSCLPGHYGPSCDACVNDYFWNQDRCVACSCLKLCSNNQGHQHCYNCEFVFNDLIDVAKRKCSPGPKHVSHRDGTVAIVAVVVSLAFIGAVAGGIYYYRYKTMNQSHNSLWSMELHEEKVSLNSACDYQRLDAAAINAKQDSIGKRPGVRPQSHNNKSDGNHKYHCISI